ncbi:MAG: dihydrofolate reductase family protein [Elusimicrobia bacterium]|nr:dihydrofolate reductase family protein [Elusimicrobiota bacterium]
MGQLTFGLNVTLDGCCDHRAIVADDELFRYWTRLMDAAGGMLWGRTVYELMESYWPAVARDPKARPLDRDWARKLDAKPKYVVSSARRDFPWSNTHLVKGDLAGGVKDLKKRTPRGLLLGSPALAKELHRLGLIDEYLLVVHPIVAGHGPTLFVDWRASRLKFIDAKHFKSGVVALRYRRK